jgi:hypothetical protein
MDPLLDQLEEDFVIRSYPKNPGESTVGYYKCSKIAIELCNVFIREIGNAHLILLSE